MSKYESPIFASMVDEMVDQVRKEQENAIIQRVKMVVDVDKNELLRALAYDRGQYEKGYKDGYEAAKVDNPQMTNGQMFEKVFGLAGTGGVGPVKDWWSEPYKGPKEG